MHIIRSEQPKDIPGIRHVNRSAFETAIEADLVDTLRQQAQPIVSLIAVDGDAVVGHILFSPVTLLSHPEVPIMGLAPMAVLPVRQRQGIGSELVRAGLEECRRLGFVAVSWWATPRTIRGLALKRHPATAWSPSTTSLTTCSWPLN